MVSNKQEMQINLDDLICIYLRKCIYCGCDVAINNANREHVYPKSKGGPMNMSNIVLSCRRCNELKSDKLMDEDVYIGTMKFINLVLRDISFMVYSLAKLQSKGCLSSAMFNSALLQLQEYFECLNNANQVLSVLETRNNFQTEQMNTQAKEIMKELAYNMDKNLQNIRGCNPKEK